MKTNQTTFVVLLIWLTLFAGCGEQNAELPTTPIPTPVPTPTPAPPAADISGEWTGTYNTNDDIDCDTTVALSAIATFEQNGSSVKGTLIANGYCGLNYPFEGTLVGNILKGTLTGTLNPSGNATGTVSGSKLEIGASNGYGYLMGAMHLHRK